jgi:hypothetical protein
MGNERPTMALPNQVDERFSHDSEHPLHPTQPGRGALVPDQTSRGAGRSLVAPGRSLCTTTGSDATGITLDERAVSVQMTRTLGRPRTSAEASVRGYPRPRQVAHRDPGWPAEPP